MLPLPGWLAEFRHPIAAWFALRLSTIAAALYAITSLPIGETVQVPGYAPPVFSGVGEGLFGAWLRADALWYLKISTQGYSASDGTLAFFPCYPLLIALFRPVFGGNEAIAALFVSASATLLGMIFLHRFVTLALDRRLADAAVWGLALFPTSFFLMAPYAEGLFLMLGSWAMLAAYRGNVPQAFVAGALAGLCRPFGVLLSVLLFFLCSDKIKMRRAIAVAVGPLLGLVAWLGSSAVITGDPLGGLKVQQRWQRQAALPWETVVDGVGAWWSYRATEYGAYFLLDVGALLCGLLLIALAIRYVPNRRVRYGLTLYGAGVIIVPLASVFPGRPLLSLPRFLLALFPLLGLWGVASSPIRRILAGFSAGGLIFLTVAFVAARPIF